MTIGVTGEKLSIYSIINIIFSSFLFVSWDISRGWGLNLGLKYASMWVIFLVSNVQFKHDQFFGFLLGATPGSAWGTIFGARDQTSVGGMQSKYLKHFTISLALGYDNFIAAKYARISLFFFFLNILIL